MLKRLCPVRVPYTYLLALIPPQAIEGLGALLATPGSEVPGGGCMSTVADIHRFAGMLRRGGELNGNRLLSPAMLDFCTRNHTGALRNVLFDMIVVFPSFSLSLSPICLRRPGLLNSSIRSVNGLAKSRDRYALSCRQSQRKPQTYAKVPENPTPCQIVS